MVNYAKGFVQVEMPKVREERSSVLLAILSSQRAILRAMGESAMRDDLTLQQFAVLRIIGARGSLPMVSLSEELRVSPPNVTGMVDRLERKGLVVRTDDPMDRRRKEIRLTEKGEQLYKKVRQGYSDSLQDALDSLSPQEQEALAALMKKFAKEIAARTGSR